MGGFYGSIHVRADSNQLIKRVLEMVAQKKKRKFYLAPPINGWVGVFPDGYGQDERLSKFIAKQLDYDVLHLMVHDDDTFCYWFYRNGNLVDEYNSHPGYFGEFVSRKKREKLKGNPDVFNDLVTDHTKIPRIREILCKPKDLSKDALLDPNIIEKLKRFEEVSKEIKKFINDPDSIIRFLAENPHLLDEKTRSLAQEAKNTGLMSPEELQKLIAKPEHIQDIIGRLITGFLKSRGFMNETGNWTEDLTGSSINARSDESKFKDGFIGKTERYQPPAGLFASETMRQFADLLGITNAVTSYEYLAAGEIDNILEWNRFAEVL
jgi:hypothetical protein